MDGSRRCAVAGHHLRGQKASTPTQSHICQRKQEAPCSQSRGDSRASESVRWSTCTHLQCAPAQTVTAGLLWPRFHRHLFKLLYSSPCQDTSLMSQGASTFGYNVSDWIQCQRSPPTTASQRTRRRSLLSTQLQFGGDTGMTSGLRVSAGSFLDGRTEGETSALTVTNKGIRDVSVELHTQRALGIGPLARKSSRVEP